MRARVDEALSHIPEGRPGSAQNTLRMDLNVLYQNLLKENQDTPPGTALAAAADSTRRTFPDFEPDYDRDYFGEL